MNDYSKLDVSFLLYGELQSALKMSDICGIYSSICQKDTVSREGKIEVEIEKRI